MAKDYILKYLIDSEATTSGHLYKVKKCTIDKRETSGKDSGKQ